MSTTISVNPDSRATVPSAELVKYREAKERLTGTGDNAEFFRELFSTERPPRRSLITKKLAEALGVRHHLSKPYRLLTPS
jgi:hypothetical protein